MINNMAKKATKKAADKALNIQTIFYLTAVIFYVQQEIQAHSLKREI